MEPNNETTQALAAPAAAISLGFDNADTFALLQRAAKMLSNSTLVPPQYRAVKEIKEYGKVVGTEENLSAVSNCVIALNIARRMRADELMVMQNLYVVEGRPAWSAQWVIGAVNTSGKFTPLRFDISELGDKEVEYSVVEWEAGKKSNRKVKQAISNTQCIAWCFERGTPVPNDVRTLTQAKERDIPVLESPPVSIEMAVLEGWYGKAGSKWQTMPEVMLRYRAAAFFGRLYAPELLMGLPSADEVHDEPIVERAATGREVPAEVPPAMFTPEREPAESEREQPKPEREPKPERKRTAKASQAPAEAPAAAEAPAPEAEAQDAADGQEEAVTAAAFWKACDTSKMDRGIVMAILKRNGLTEGNAAAELTNDEVELIKPLWGKLKTTYVSEIKKGGAKA